MNIQDIPLILPNFNQLTYLQNIINWWKWYYPKNPYYIIDNGSTYEPLIDFYDSLSVDTVFRCPGNEFIPHLRMWLGENKPEYYCLSDPDIMPHPTTPPDFLEIFMACIDAGFHHVGFDLITDDIPDWNTKKGWILGDEKALHSIATRISYKGIIYEGFKAPIDTTFALYANHNGGWAAPQTAEAWTNSLRLFKAFHFGWYLHPQFINEEMKNYFATCKKFVPGELSAGKNNYRP